MGKKTIYSAEYRSLVERLRAHREAQSLSQSALAMKLGWPQQRLSAVEAGSRRLDVMEYFQLTAALRMTRHQAMLLIPLEPKSR